MLSARASRLVNEDSVGVSLVDLAVDPAPQPVDIGVYSRVFWTSAAIAPADHACTKKLKTCTWPWPFCFTSTEARMVIRDGDRGEEDGRVKARPRLLPEKDRRDRGPPPEQWKCYGGVPSPLRSD